MTRFNPPIRDFVITLYVGLLGTFQTPTQNSKEMDTPLFNLFFFFLGLRQAIENMQCAIEKTTTTNVANRVFIVRHRIMFEFRLRVEFEFEFELYPNKPYAGFLCCRLFSSTVIAITVLIVTMPVGPSKSKDPAHW